MTSGFDPPILTSSNGPTHGPRASVLAMSAPITSGLRLHWNSPERPGGGIDVTVEEKLHISRRWQITSADSWLHVTDSLIRGEHIRATPGELALDIRDELLEGTGAAYLDLDGWVAAVYAHGEQSSWTDEQTDLVVRQAVKSFHVEQQLATDGLLPPGERIVTMFAHDLANAAYLVYAGARLGYANPTTAEQMLDALGHNASNVDAFQTWAQFGAAYVAASSVLYGGYPTDAHYIDAAGTVRTLLSSPMSPWTNIGFPGRSAP
ncbi:Protein of unknown function [Gordonia malaquae]|uniref:DUF1266 domain-containing protein n=1 Tax=Gordonia malaquae NBRC 108250 TaxID=1223542 RepID=M3UK80_GORML|nr:DUF1266 domain-containing protein [Gordonia malaquae]GAC80005.1 hypothetical protein GM1_013_01420 [Gordonia malaquae NBRC 108250]SEB86514.1 Protein of unknown function [Gordonia malaquae]